MGKMGKIGTRLDFVHHKECKFVIRVPRSQSLDDPLKPIRGGIGGFPISQTPSWTFPFKEQYHPNLPTMGVLTNTVTDIFMKDYYKRKLEFV